jgi:hypothetical protein
MTALQGDIVKDMGFGRELIDDLSSGSMPDLYTAVGGECSAADLQQRLCHSAMQSFVNIANETVRAHSTSSPDYRSSDQ